MYAFDYHWAMRPAQLRRYAIRIDGFVSYRATYAPCKLVSKPFVFTGNSLSINFATSAAGHVKIRLVGETAALESIELFGERYPLPILIAPCGSQKAFHPEGELTVARAAKAKGVEMILSTVASTAVEDVNAARGKPV